MEEIVITADAIDVLGNYVMFGFSPGSFYEEILIGDSDAAYKKAHEVIRHQPEVIENLIQWINELFPEDCYGSREIVEAWKAHDGWNGASDETKVLFKLRSTPEFYNKLILNC